MGSRRGRLDIIVDILQTAKTGEKKTRIMCKAKLSFAQLEFYLRLLEKYRLIENFNGEFATTKKGLKLIEEFRMIYSILSQS